ncbi:MAG: LamG-like jellyroll fold domain-containing protein, partial [Kiritimatiellia bacterium]
MMQRMVRVNPLAIIFMLASVLAALGEDVKSESKSSLIDWRELVDTPRGLDVGEAGPLQPFGKVESNLADVYQMRYTIRFAEQEVPAYRTFIRVEGKYPYLLMLEDYPGFAEAALFERGLSLVPGSELSTFVYDKGGDDLVLQASDGTEQVVRILQRSAAPATRLAPGQREGGPAMVTTSAEGKKELVIPVYSEQPSYRIMLLDNPQNLPDSKWLNNGEFLRVEWHDQVDEFRFATAEDGRTRFLLERKRGDYLEEVVSVGMPYTPPERATGNLIGHWSFDVVKDRRVRDDSGRGHHATLEGGVRLTPGIRGVGLDGVSCEGVEPGALVIPTLEGVLPGEPSTGMLRIPGGVLAGVSNRMSISFWYAMPPRVQGGFKPYLDHWSKWDDRTVLETAGLKIYSYDHFLGGQRLTASALGHHRLFGMIGPLMEPDRWNHYVITLDEQVGRLYINGELRMQQDGNKELAGTLSGQAEIEALKNTWGRMDELRFFDYPLDQESVQQLFRMEGQERLVRLDFDDQSIGPVRDGVLFDPSGFACKTEGAEIIARGEG